MRYILITQEEQEVTCACDSYNSDATIKVVKTYPIEALSFDGARDAALSLLDTKLQPIRTKGSLYDADVFEAELVEVPRSFDFGDALKALKTRYRREWEERRDAEAAVARQRQKAERQRVYEELKREFEAK